MGVVVVTPRSGDLIELSFAKSHLGVEDDAHDALIRAYIEATADWLDGPRGWLGLCLGRQTLRLSFDYGLRQNLLDLPCGPVSSIVSIGYKAATGELQLLDPQSYELRENRVHWLNSASWPAPLTAACEVEYVAGYEAGKLPATIKAAMLLHLNILYDQPDGPRLAALERARDDLLSPVRQRTF